MRRREFLTIPVASIGGTLLYTLAGEPFRLKAQTGSKDGTLKVPLRFFTAKEARVVAAACERICLSYDTGPSATEASVVIFIDRQLAGLMAATNIVTSRRPGSSPCPNTAIRAKRNRRRFIGRASKISATSTACRSTNRSRSCRP
jgi:hypothetical protein